MGIRILIFGFLVIVNCIIGQLTKEWFNENIIRADTLSELEDDYDDKIKASSIPTKPILGEYDAMFTIRVRLGDVQVMMRCENESDNGNVGLIDLVYPNATKCIGLELVNLGQSRDYWSVIRVSEVGGLYEEPAHLRRQLPIYGGHVEHSFTATILTRKSTRYLGKRMHLRIQFHRSSFSETRPWRIQWIRIPFLSSDSSVLNESIWTAGDSIEIHRYFSTNDLEANYTLSIINDLNQTVFSKDFEFFKISQVSSFGGWYFDFDVGVPLESITSSEYLDQIVGTTARGVDSRKYYFQANDSFLFSCKFHGYPFSWENAGIYWKKRKCTLKIDEPGVDDQNGVRMLSDQVSFSVHRLRLLLVAKETGAYFCGYEGDGKLIGYSSTPQEFVVVDSPNGKPVYAERVEPSAGPILDGDRIILRAIVNPYRYELPVWKMGRSSMEIGYPYNQDGRKTTLIPKANSLIFELIIENATFNDSDYYCCEARRKEERRYPWDSIFESNPMDINVEEGMEPYAGEDFFSMDDSPDGRGGDGRNRRRPPLTIRSIQYSTIDYPGSIPVFARRLEPLKLPIIVGRRIVLQAIINRFLYEAPVWRTRDRFLEIGHPYDQDGRKTSLIKNGKSLIFQLIIANATINDSDQYRCIARRKTETFESDPLLNITVQKGIRPHFGVETYPMGNLIVPRNSITQFICDAKGFPDPKIEWIKNGEPIVCEGKKCSEKIRIEGKNLTILNMEPADAGRFMCRIQNRLGFNEYMFTLSIEESEVEESERRKQVILGTSLTLAFLLIVASAIILIKYWRSYKAKESIQAEIMELEEHLHQNLGNDQDVNDPGEAPRYYLEIQEENVVDGSKLGEGFFGKVYKSYMQFGESIKWQVATKYIKKSKHREQFKNEVKLMEKLPYHVNVVTLLGVVVSSRTCKMICAVLEYCDHGSLWDFIHMHTVQSSSSGQSSTIGSDSLTSSGCQVADEEAPESPCLQNESKDAKMTEYKDPILIEAAITEIDLLSFAYQIALGMAHLNRNDIFHGDVALRNMLLTKSLIVKVADFGCARREDSDIDKEGAVPWKWAAPETLKNGQLMRKSDVWSFGIAIHELYSDGKEPFRSIQSPNCLLNQLDHFSIQTLMPKPGKCPQEIYELLLDCWILNEQDRPEFVQCHERINEYSLSVHSQNWENILEHLRYVSGRSEEHISNVKQLIRNWNDERLGNKSKDNVIPDQSC